MTKLNELSITEAAKGLRTKEFTVRELAEKVIAQTGSASKIVEEPLPQDDPKQRQPDISKAKRELGWEPKVPLEQGLVKTIDYFRQFA